ncbi:MAG: HDIG domain-containing protein [Desulfobulbus sp.]|jgi:putative nucleotidyltransferase with HDIG domain|uniref:HDIG domain-containing metalloprotein n=1 Tax=Desulfobulbus sp. TaxID=895 RepID=UPI00284D6306|nr:HDIG domain-containing metalloprotein [Desulfobulbus sp.]MDR2550086.1 HDIG domain-containing protein [Desulfobulbus sp.]
MDRSVPAIPSLAQCIDLMEQYGMLPNIRHHSLVVARLAEQLQGGLCAVAPDRHQADRHLVISGALLHDIAKTPCLNSTCDHAKAGADICRRHGYPEIAAIVEQHVRLWDFAPARYEQGRFDALELVYYADKRVRHNVVVHLDQRLEYIIDHYGKGNPERQALIRENFDKCVTLEHHLFRWLPFGPADLGRF